MIGRPTARDAVLAAVGVAIGLGGLALQDDVGVWSWIVAPLVIGVLLPMHVRALFAGDGPFRT
jgi:hypothetical protein